MLSFGFFKERTSEATFEFGGIRFPISVLHVLLAQSASAEVVRRYENEGDVFKTILVNKEFQTEFVGSYVHANVDYYDSIKRHVPERCRRILDIGAGIGLVDLLLYRDLAEERPGLYLFDKSVDVSALMKTGIAPTGFNDQYVFTASLELAAKFLVLNGVAPQDIHLCEVDAWKIQDGAPFDLVISRKSWGFHYPIEEYLEDVVGSLGRKAVVIADVRSDQGGEAKLSESFNNLGVIKTGRKSSLMIASDSRIQVSS